MMLPTHILAGGSLGFFISLIAPEMQLTLILTGMVAGILPDLDMFFEHRKTLHRPMEFGLLFIVSLGIYTFTGVTLLLALSTFLGSITLHTVSEILGQGKTMTPELKKDERCVYNHLNQEWIKPMRIIKGGSAKDLFLAMALSIPLFVTSRDLIVKLTFLILSLGLIQFILLDWITKNLLSEYDRFSEAIQYKIGYGPEVKN